MVYSDMFKRKMIQKMSGTDPISACALSKQVDVPQTTLSKWLRNAGIEPFIGFSNNTYDKEVYMRHTKTAKRPEDWKTEKKLAAVLEAATLSDEQLGAFLRSKGLHETHLQQWWLQMLNGLDNVTTAKKRNRNAADTKRIRALEKELKRKDKALAETAALLVLKKKVHQIWGDEDDDTALNFGK